MDETEAGAPEAMAGLFIAAVYRWQLLYSLHLSELVICDRVRFGLMHRFSDHMKTGGACLE